MQQLDAGRGRRSRRSCQPELDCGCRLARRSTRATRGKSRRLHGNGGLCVFMGDLLAVPAAALGLRVMKMSPRVRSWSGLCTGFTPKRYGNFAVRYWTLPRFMSRIACLLCRQSGCHPAGEFVHLVIANRQILLFCLGLDLLGQGNGPVQLRQELQEVDLLDRVERAGVALDTVG
jgi:hypothetical protein